MTVSFQDTKTSLLLRFIFHNRLLNSCIRFLESITYLKHNRVPLKTSWTFHLARSVERFLYFVVYPTRDQHTLIKMVGKMLLPIEGEVDWETKRFPKNSWKLKGKCNWSLVKTANSSVYNSENHRMCSAVLRWWSWTFFASSTKYSRNSRSRSEWNLQFRFIRPFLLGPISEIVFTVT